MNRDISSRGNHLEDTRANTVSHVSLVCVDLKNDSVLHKWCVLWLMLLLIVRVDSMGHIGGQKERSVDCLEVFLLVELVFTCVSSKDTLSDLHGSVGIGTLGRLRSDLLVIKENDHIDLSMVTLLCWEL